MNVGSLAAVEVDGVSMSFGPTRALKNVSVRVEQGECRALVGRNGAGKSTLVGILTGVLAPDRGELRYHGRPAPRLGDRSAWRNTVACVYQRSNLVPTLSVTENLMLNRMPERRGGFVSHRAARAQAVAMIAEWGIDALPDQPISELSVADAQLVEIARELSLGSGVLILDEPTARLERDEVKRLFDALKSAQADGTTIVYISHHLEEVFELASSVTVLRDGEHVLTTSMSGLSQTDLVDAMVGEREQTTVLSDDDLGEVSASLAEVVARPRPVTDEVLRVSDLGVAGGPGVSFSVGRGEVIGLAGHVGSGSLETAAVLAGLSVPQAGVVMVDGQPLQFGRPDKSIELGIGFVPKDRAFNGFVPQLGAADNIALPVMPWINVAGFVESRKRESLTATLATALDIRMASQSQEVRELSGGNQQKVVVSRSLAANPLALVLVQPTAGVDIASKEKLMGAVAAATRLGVATVIVSDEVAELRACDRVLVLVRGAITAELQRGWTERELVAELEGFNA